MDVLIEPRSAALLSGPSRHALHHGTRLGLDCAELARLAPDRTRHSSARDAGSGTLWDWFGGLKCLVRREPTRLSVIFAFGDIEKS